MQARMARAVTAGLVTLLMSAAFASAQPAPPRRPTNLVGITSAADPPVWFDPLTATPADLAGYGFPPRPNPVADAAGYADWAHAMAAHPRRIAPVLTRSRTSHGPVHGWVGQGSGATSRNWSGYVARGTATGFSAPSFTSVVAALVVPNPYAPTCDGTTAYSAGWVGIDGWNSPDVLQAGFEADATCRGGVTTTTTYPWIEWYPGAAGEIINLPVAPGDSLYVHVWATGATQGHAYIQNLGGNVAVTADFGPPAGTALVGNVAEWVVEAPSVNGSIASLAAYGLDIAAAASAQTPSGSVAFPGSPRSVAFTMVGNTGTALSAPALLGASGVAFVYQFPAATAAAGAINN